MTAKNQKTDLILRIICVLVVAVVPALHAASARPPEPKTVADFFLLVPERYLPYSLRFREEMLRGQYRSALVDVRNGYISWDASDAPDSFEFVIFKKSNGRYVVAYNDTGDDFDQEPEAPDLILLSYEEGRWRDVTRALLPVASPRKPGYKLPRQGRSIEVTDESGRKLYTLTWENDRFHVQRAAGK